jgi:predicted nucleotidyltransferase
MKIKKKILFLGCNKEQTKYLKEIRKLNKFIIIGTDINDLAYGKKYCDKFYKLSYENSKKLIDIGVKENFNKFDKVFTASSQVSYISASEFAKKFNIKFPKPQNIKKAIDKAKFYEFLKKNKINVPKFYIIKNKKELKKKLNENFNKIFYLKSDYSKNPNYVYQIYKSIDLNINWKKDRFLKKCYIFQEFCYGTHIRVNFFENKFNFFYTKKKFLVTKNFIKNNIISKIKKIVTKLELSNMIVKFDIIVNKKNNFYFLDLGIDPPYRMRKKYLKKKINFEKLYINKYLLNSKNNFRY